MGEAVTGDESSRRLGSGSGDCRSVERSSGSGELDRGAGRVWTGKR